MLAGVAQQWFLSLLPRLIDKFETLVYRFLTHFAGGLKV